MSIVNERGNSKLIINGIEPTGDVEYSYSASFDKYLAEQYSGGYLYTSRFVNYFDEQTENPVAYTYSSEFTKYLSEQIEEPELV